MEEQKRSLDAEARRRRLDELFADEPFLSATMKARRLHEKMQELQAQETEAQRLPSQAYVRDVANGAPRFASGAPDPLPAILPEQPPVLKTPSVPAEPSLQAAPRVEEEAILAEAPLPSEEALVQAEAMAEEIGFEEPILETEAVIQREPLSLDEMVSLAEAAGFLRDGIGRGRVSPACAERLLCFRDEVLRQWREGAPEREQC